MTEFLVLEAFKMFINADINSCQAKFDKANSLDVLEMMCAQSGSDGLHIIQFSRTVLKYTQCCSKTLRYLTVTYQVVSLPDYKLLTFKNWKWNCRRKEGC